MAEEHADNEMIEIGDPDEEPSRPEPPTRVVIEYRERGVPWMLIPPLLIISALGAVLLYHKLAPEKIPPHPPALARDAVRPEAPDAEQASTANTITPAATPAPVSVEKPVEPVVTPVETTELVPDPAKGPDPAPFPRVQGLGFDPKALEAERNVEAPADPLLAAAQDVRLDDPNQPREVDPADLPPDPRLARARQKQRLAEAIRKAEADRVRFHADLSKICQKFREASGPEIRKLFEQYENQVEPTVQKQAAKLLGKTGAFVGADRASRISLLRRLGFPEPAILSDLYEQSARHQSRAERGGMNSESEVLYVCAIYLLKNPPSAANRQARPASSNRGSAESLAPGMGTPTPGILGSSR